MPYISIVISKINLSPFTRLYDTRHVYLYISADMHKRTEFVSIKQKMRYSMQACAMCIRHRTLHISFSNSLPPQREKRGHPRPGLTLANNLCKSVPIQLEQANSCISLCSDREFESVSYRIVS